MKKTPNQNIRFLGWRKLPPANSAPIVLAILSVLLLCLQHSRHYTWCLQYFQCFQDACNTLNAPMVLATLSVLPWSWQYSHCSHGSYCQCSDGDCSLNDLMVQYVQCSHGASNTLNALMVLATLSMLPLCLQNSDFSHCAYFTCSIIIAVSVIPWWLLSMLSWCLQ